MTRSFPLPDDGRSISRNEALLNILVHDVINLLYYSLLMRLNGDSCGVMDDCISVVFSMNRVRVCVGRLALIYPKLIRSGQNLIMSITIEI